ALDGQRHDAGFARAHGDDEPRGHGAAPSGQDSGLHRASLVASWSAAATGGAAGARQRARTPVRARARIRPDRYQGFSRTLPAQLRWIGALRAKACTAAPTPDASAAAPVVGNDNRAGSSEDEGARSVADRTKERRLGVRDHLDTLR